MEDPLRIALVGVVGDVEVRDGQIRRDPGEASRRDPEHLMRRTEQIDHEQRVVAARHRNNVGHEHMAHLRIVGGREIGIDQRLHRRAVIRRIADECRFTVFLFGADRRLQRLPRLIVAEIGTQDEAQSLMLSGIFGFRRRGDLIDYRPGLDRGVLSLVGASR